MIERPEPNAMVGLSGWAWAPWQQGSTPRPPCLHQQRKRRRGLPPARV